MQGRLVTLVLCRRDGTVLGALPPYEVAVRWWPEARPVVEGARALYGLDVTVLRLLGGDPDAPGPSGGPVTYLAEVDRAPEGLTLWPGDPTAEEPLRLPWARPGGPAADLAWADAVLAQRGTSRTGPAEQVRTWNLSSLWRLPLGEDAAWLKVVPPFFAHEGLMLERLDPTLVPPLIAAAGPRVLLAEVPGEDQYDATGTPLLRMVGLLVALQAQWSGRVDELVGLGLPDWRPHALAPAAADVVARTAGALEPSTVSECERLIAGLPARFAAIADCRLPDTLVHGDFHRGNVRGAEGRLVLLDWGDCGVGHPLLDQTAFLEYLTAADRAPVRAEWARLWRDVQPGSDPDRAAALLGPVGALRQAVIYQSFLDQIEPDERVYHASDPAEWLERAAELSAAATS